MKNAPHRKSGRGIGGRAGRRLWDGSTTERAARLINGQIERVATTAERRHAALYNAAKTVGGALHAAETSQERVLERLTTAAEGVGLPHAEAVRTARDGLERGVETPLDLGRARTHVGRGPLRVQPQPAPPHDAGQRAHALELWRLANVEGRRDDEHVAAHPYCQDKLVRHAFGAGRITHKGRDLLCVPVKRDGVGDVVAVQIIAGDGQKRTYGRLEDAYLLLGDERDKRHPWIVCEGWATAHGFVVANTINRTPAPVLVAFGSRLETVASTARETYGASVVCMPDGAAFDE